MHILITRPEGQAKKTGNALAQLGHSSANEPLLQIEPTLTPLPQGHHDALIVTSLNALAALDEAWPSQNRDEVPLLATGSTTARATKELGFSKSQHVSGSALDLIAKVPDWMEQNNLEASSQLLYPGAETAAHDVAKLLSDLAINCHRWIVYRALPANQFSPRVKNALRHGDFDAVLLYSKRTAHTFVQLMRQNEISMVGLRAYVLSSEILDSLPEELKSNARCASQPSENELLGLIGS